MLPDFDDNGNLPPGIHLATLETVVARFGQGSEEREVEGKELADFVHWARTAGISRLLVDGSFVTAKIAPNDVDVVILPGPGYPLSGEPVRTKVDQWPFVHVIVATDEVDLDRWARHDFGIDKRGTSRGIVEVNL